MKTKFDYQTSIINDNKYDIYEVGGDVIAFSVKWEFVELIINKLNKYYEDRS